MLQQAKNKSKLPGLATGTAGGASLGGMALGVPAPPLPNIWDMNCLVKSSALLAAPALSASKVDCQLFFYKCNENVA